MADINIIIFYMIFWCFYCWNVDRITDYTTGKMRVTLFLSCHGPNMSTSKLGYFFWHSFLITSTDKQSKSKDFTFSELKVKWPNLGKQGEYFEK